MSLDFLQIRERDAKKSKDDGGPGLVVYPDFRVGRFTDLMVRAHSFLAIWHEALGLWSTDEYDVATLVDRELWAYRNQRAEETGMSVRVELMEDFSSGAWTNFQRYLKNVSDNVHALDENLVFANTEIKKTDYASKRLPYSLEEGDISAWDEIVSTLYSPEEREKIEWIIGAIISGDSKHIHKMGVFYGPPGTGKSTIISIIQHDLFPGYINTFEAKTLTGNNNAFASEVFKSNPLVAIEHDGDLSQIKDYTKLNSIVSHEVMLINEKFKPAYEMAVSAFLLVGTNKSVLISDAMAGILRRLIDINPTGDLLPSKRYHALMSKVAFETGAIAYHCLQEYLKRGKNFYEGYRPLRMMMQTDVFYNYIEYYYDVFSSQPGVTLDAAYTMYKEFATDTEIKFKLERHRFREELRNYFEDFDERATVDGTRVRNWYSGFKIDKFKSQTHAEDEAPYSLVMDESVSIFDEMMAEMPAQYEKADGSPTTYWDQVDTTLEDIDTRQVHYVRVPEHHIVIDFDLKDENGEKSPELNLAAASEWPATYSEYSKSGGGIHLHYNYVGDIHELSRIYKEDIEIKVFTGKTSLRRKLSFCNNVPVATINGGLPLKEKKKMINATQIKSEEGLRDLIGRHLRKEIMHATKPSVDMINKVLDEAYSNGLAYDVTDLKPQIIAFANGSTNQALGALKMALNMKYVGQTADTTLQEDEFVPDDSRLAIFDVEVYPNLFVICWKYQGEDTIQHMINPAAHEVEQLLRLKLVGFNNRRYDNHILYAAKMGYSNEALYKLSQKIINGEAGALFGAAYNLSWVDIYEMAMTKQGLKKWEAELGLHHVEMDIPWDEPAPKELWDRIVAYCDNDVNATESVLEHLDADYTARLILADISELSVNSTTQQHTARIIFGDDRNPQSQFVYTDLSEMFPGYEFKRGKSTYRGEEVGEGGLVRAEPGMHSDVALYDVQSMHPNSIIALNAFGTKYTARFKELVDARVAIKHGDYEAAGKMFGGKLKPFLKDKDQAEALSTALKIAINIVYGMTSAGFPNMFKDPRNKDNIVAKRGALFMMDLKAAVEELGYQVVHVKTDSIKIPGATKEVWDFVYEFGLKYGYVFEHEATYEKMALVNDAVYIAKVGWAAKEKYIGKWTATGAQFQQPYVFKTLFSKEPIEFKDLCLTKSVTSKMYLDFNGDDKDLTFVGKVGVFVPVTEGGGELVREGTGDKADTFSAVTGTKDYKFQEASVIKANGDEDKIDMSYYNRLVDDAIENISKHGDFEWFVS